MYRAGNAGSAGTACLFEPLGAGVHGVESADVSGKTVLVSGCGPIGLTAVSASKVFGARRVIACDLVVERLETALAMRADFVINSSEQDASEEVKKLTGGLGADAAIDITGAGAAIRSALQSLRAGGRLVCVGLPTSEVSLDLTSHTCNSERRNYIYKSSGLGCDSLDSVFTSRSDH